MSTWGRYQLLSALGTGGQARVYEAVLHGPGAPLRVALKVYERRDAVPHREGRLGGLLRHPNLVDVYEVGERDDKPFCAMELCAGGALEGKGTLPPRAVVEVGLQVCAALGYAWAELGLVHLDLKPANLLLDGATVKVADLGIARARGFEDGGVYGTRGYMAPELMRGAEVDTRADIYALGVVLMELASGPVGGVSAETSAFTDDDFGDGEAPVAHGWLEPVTSRCLDPDPRGRFDTMEALAEALRGLVVDGPGLAEWLGVGPREASVADPPIGRDRELSTLRKLLERPGIVTLKGPGGIGKTSLARHLDHVGAGVPPALFIDCRDHASDLDLLHAVADALGLTGSAELAARIGFSLAARPLVLILDAFDHLESAPVLAGWLGGASSLRILVTSHRRTGLPGENVVEVGPLSDADALALMIHRVRQRGHDVSADPALPSLAARLGGVPLALELAAGRIGVLSVAEVEERLGWSFLRSAGTDRHATLRSTLDWSWDQLDPQEQRSLARLTVFLGGFGLAAAEHVLDEPDAFARLASLADRSLIRRVDAPGVRYDLLRPVREHAADRADPHELHIAEENHGSFFAARPSALIAVADRENVLVAARRAIAAGRANSVRLCEIATDLLDLTGPYSTALELVQGAQSLSGLIRRDQANLARMEIWALQQLGRTDDVLAAIPAARALAEGEPTLDALILRSHAIALRLRTQMDAARTSLETALALHTDADTRARLLITLGGHQLDQGLVEPARASFREAYALHKTLPGRRERTALANLAMVELHTGDSALAARMQAEAIEACRAVADRRGEAQLLGDLAHALANLGRDVESERTYSEALAAHRAQGNRRFEGAVLANFGLLLRRQGRWDEAEACFREAKTLQTAISNRRAVGIVLTTWAGLIAARGRSSEAEVMYREALEIHRSVKNPRFEGHTLGSLAVVLARLDRRDEALQAAEQAEAQLRALGEPETIAVALCDRTEVDGNVARLVEAEVLAKTLPSGSGGPILARIAALRAS